MKTKIYIVLAMILSFSCNATRPVQQSSKDSSIIIATLKENLSAYQSKHDISKGLYKNYRVLYGLGTSLADKDEDFNPYDFQVQGEPMRRFIFGASSISKTYELFVFEEGGVALKNYCVVAKKDHGQIISLIQAYLYRRAGGVNELKDIVNENAYRID